jgi:acetate kinase
VRALVVNAGSTSLKLSIVGDGHDATYDSLDDALHEQFDVVVHRVVHGGARRVPALLDDALVEEIRALVELAPLHQPAALALIDRCRAELPDRPQYACFDTSFHATIAPAARTYAIPARWRARVVAYGFHGISHAWATRQLATVASDARRLVVAHLGGGSSLCAVRDGESVQTTMGFTPLDGLVMATRAGAIDPGAVLWMADQGADVAHVLQHESGLLGLCGDADMRVVLRRAEGGDEEAQLALDVYVHRLVTAIGAAVAALEGIDALVFTGGVGERSADLRARTCAHLAWLGVAVQDGDAEPAAEAGDGPVREITASGALVRTFVVHAHEELEMLQQVTELRR